MSGLIFPAPRAGRPVWVSVCRLALTGVLGLMIAWAPVAASDTEARDLYVSPTGTAGAPGTMAQPTTLASALTRVLPGYTVYVRGGTYSLNTGLSIARGNNGLPEAPKTLAAYPGETPVLNFSGQAVGSTARGLTLNGNHWHLVGLVVERAGDNGIFIGGHHNIIELCVTRFSADTGLQLGRYSSTASRADWPSYNLILNCTSHDNRDPGEENADGFAAKLTTGPGNAFIGCIAHNNIDDGWDLYTKTDTGPIDPVVLDRCIAYDNGVLSDGTSSGSGDKNGFKLGGEKIPVAHVVTRSIAFGNGKNGFTWNSNPGAIRMFNNLAFDNAEGNYKFDLAGPIFRNNTSLWTSGTGKNDRYGGNAGTATGASNVFWFASGNPKSRNDQGIQISAASFVSLSVPAGGFARRADGSIELGDFARPVSGSPLINAGTFPASEIWSELPYDPASYHEHAPDIGVVEVLLASPPSVLAAPAGVTRFAGEPAGFTVEVGGTAPFTYQWHRDGTPLAGGNAATLTLPAVTLADAGSYTVTVQNAFGAVTSPPAVLVVQPVIAPYFMVQPDSRTVNAGFPTMFTAAVGGTAPFSYQWRRNGISIAGATADSLSLAAVSAADAGTYTVVVTNASGATESAGAVLNVDSTPVAPVIVGQPQEISVIAGQSAVFTVHAVGTPGLAFQWFRNGVALAGATADTLEISAVQTADVGFYHVVVSNAAGSSASAAVLLEVRMAADAVWLNDAFADGNRTGQNPPGSAAWFSSSSSITTGVGSLTHAVSSSRTLHAHFTGTSAAPVTLAPWQRLTAEFTFHYSGFDTAAAPGSATFVAGLFQSVANPAATSGTGFTPAGSPNTNARVTGDYGSGQPTSGVFSLYTGYAAAAAFGSEPTDTPVTFRRRDKAAVNFLNSTAPFTTLDAPAPAAASSGMETDAEYRATLTLSRTPAGLELEFVVVRTEDGAPIMEHSTVEPDATFASFDTVALYVTKAASSANYSFILRRTKVELTNLPVIVSPTVAVPPTSLSVGAGAPAVFSVVAAGAGAPYTYQWRRNGVPIPGATGPTHAIAAATVEDAGQYDVVVGNVGGSTTSAPAMLAVAAGGYGAWAEDRFSAEERANPVISGPAASAAGDGVANLFKYALGVDPHDRLPSDWAEMEIQAGGWVFAYRRPSGRSDLTYAVEVSHDLATWTTDGVVHEFEGVVGGEEVWRAIHVPPESAPPQVFFRLRVSR